MALAVLDDPALPHPPLEVLLTTDEEIGMLGASALNLSRIRGRKLLNLDSETEGVFTVSCAGGCVARCTIPVRWETTRRGTSLRVRLDGLTGGHSGTEIHRGRANANTVLSRVLRELIQRAGAYLVRVDGGLKDNAIPAAAEAEVITQSPEALRAMVQQIDEGTGSEF